MGALDLTATLTAIVNGHKQCQIEDLAVELPHRMIVPKGSRRPVAVVAIIEFQGELAEASSL
ncbi:hypothetical protein [Rhizobium indicum]|uniref:Uncharacterized protein n=1 Tax=Rhizobium indicum TaxID=2583231 RepID=A0ABX6PMX2_9HYPH|nr:hypothetical protein [Rhizobium indicum]QKK19991.1 hypothetical protein FFM53_026485 [Rhizobium indicum]